MLWNNESNININRNGNCQRNNNGEIEAAKWRSGMAQKRNEKAISNGEGRKKVKKAKAVSMAEAK
jgi:hypothetical protein